MALCKTSLVLHNAIILTFHFFFFQRVLGDPILAGSANPKISAEPTGICILSKEISADPSRISWANWNQHPLTLKLLLFSLFCL